MKYPFSVFFILIFFIGIARGESTQTWYQVKFDASDWRVRSLVRAGVIDAHKTADRGWIPESDYARYGSQISLKILQKEDRVVQPLQKTKGPDTLGQVLAVYPLPAQVQAPTGLAYLNGYFYLVDFDFGNEKVFQLDPADSFAVVNSFPAPGTGTLNPWGLASDGSHLYLADGIQDLIFKLDTSGAILSFFVTQGPLASGLGYRTNQLWNADLGSIAPPFPPKMYVSDTLGGAIATYSLTNATNGVAAVDTAIYMGRNKANGEVVLIMDPVTFSQLNSFPSPLEYPNGLTFDGNYLWIAGKDQGQNYIVQVDPGIPPPPPVSWTTFKLIEDGKFNNRFNVQFDSEENVHITYATQVETQSETKEIMYATNQSGVWELIQITDDSLADEIPEIVVDGNDVVHIMWNAYSPNEGDYEIYYTHNSSGEFVPKIQITSRSQDGIEGHVYPDFALDENGTVHFTFTDLPMSGIREIYYSTYSQGTPGMPVNISNNGKGDYDPKILLDQQDTPHIFWNYWASRLYHASSANSWTPEDIGPMGWTRPAIGMDSQGNIHFAVTDDQLVKYGNNQSGNFEFYDTLAVHASNCFYPEMAIDEADAVHLTYHSFGDSVNTWPGKGEIFYTNSQIWPLGNFPENISQLPAEQEIYPGIAVKNYTTRIVGWAQMGSTEGIFSNIRIATSLPDSGGFLAGKIRTSADSHHFGYIAPLDTGYWNLRIRNTGIRPLTVTDMVWDSPYEPAFEVTTNFSGPQILQWGDSLELQVTAAINIPTEADTIQYDGNLIIMSDDPVEPEKNVYLQVETEAMGVSASNRTVPRHNALYANYPNPFNPVTTIDFSVARPAQVELRVYNLRGQLVRTLIRKHLTAGLYSLRWDGTNEKGKPQASGIYFYRLKIGDEFVETRHMMLVR